LEASHDTDLLARARNGDEDAFRGLVDRYTPKIYRLIFSILGRAQESEDATQEVFFKVHRKLATFREDSAFYTWLYRVAFNTASDHLKKRKRDRTVYVEDVSRLPVEDPEGTPDEGLIRESLRKEVREALASLPEKFRLVLTLREIDGLTYEEIGRNLKLSKGTVESRIFRARSRLKAELDRRLNSPHTRLHHTP
jgi:RNA polymerase sigma-70 factor (ECF subfamily)